MTWCDCGAETIVALTPAGRAVDLDVDPVWASSPSQYRGKFILGVAGRSGAVPHATPAIPFLDGTSDGRGGPFRREHQCPF